MKFTILRAQIIKARFCGLLAGLLATLLLTPLAPSALAQDAPAPSPKAKIQVNFLNTCRPSEGDLAEVGRALARVKERPSFSADFEISRGLTTLDEPEARAAGAPAGSGATQSTWVRIHKEFPEKAVLTVAQYSLSAEGSTASEVLALHMRDTNEVLQILISDSVTGTPAQVVKVDTPPDRIRIERFGKASIVLARCSGVDQSKYEPMFVAAGGIFEKYRVAMAVKRVVPAELAHLPGHKESKAAHANH